MGQIVEVPITPSVLRWAIDQSGYSREELANRLGISPAELRDWEKGDSSPGLTEFRHLAGQLHRQAAFFFLDSPPVQKDVRVQLRRPPGSKRTELNAVERRYVREIRRYQRALEWILEELDTAKIDFPVLAISGEPANAARDLRSRLQIDTARQAGWHSTSESFRAWRSAVESLGVFVFVLPLGGDAVRGFSVWSDRAPVVVLNSAWDVAARIYTLFHEIGHLLTRTDSACLAYYTGVARSKDLLLERWCERFAAEVLIPRDDVRGLLSKRVGWKQGTKSDLAVAGKVARHYNVSLSASVLALIGVGAADQSLYAAIPESADMRSGGGGGRPRNRSEISEGRFGDRTWSIFRRAIREDLMTRADAMTYLDVADTEHHARSARD